MLSNSTNVEKNFSIDSISIEQTTPQPAPFYKGRTPEIEETISRTFQKEAKNFKRGWSTLDRSSGYDIGNIKEYKLMRKLITEASSERKDFYVLDIGTEDYQWGRGLAQYLNKKTDIPKDVTIHIIGINEKKSLSKTVEEIGQCKLYEFGEFQTENLTDEFEKKGLQLANKVDLVVSQWHFRGLTDPVGTFTQAYDLLRPKTGHLLTDGFYFLHENENIEDESIDFKERMTRLLLETKAPFLTRKYDYRYSLDHFVINKPDDRPCHLNKEYLGIQEIGKDWWTISNSVTRFKELKENNEEVSPLLRKGEYRGDKGLFERLRQNGLLYTTKPWFRSDSVWGPLQDKDSGKITPPLHTAIAKGDEEAIAECLREGCDINESDSTGASPLHVAIEHNNYKLFSTLLEKGALTNLFADEFTPLHVAAKYDFDGRFVQDLIKAGANVNIKPDLSSHPTPLDCAIEHKNLKAVELLLEAKAIVTYKNRKLLESDSTFSSIQKLLPKKISDLEGFDTIIQHVQDGDCVVLTEPNCSSGYAFGCAFQKSQKSKLIRVTVNPEIRLLKDENYHVITDLTDCQQGLIFMRDLAQKPHVELTFGF